MTVTARQLKCAALLTAKGMHPTGAAAATGNFVQESGANLPTAFRKSNLDHGSNGLAQWRLDRLSGYEAYVKSKHPDLSGEDLWPWYGRLDYQTDYVCIEMERDYPSLWAKLAKGGDPAALCADVCWQYERPSKSLSGIAYRIEAAKAISAAMPKTPHPATVETDIVKQLNCHVDEHESQKAAGSAMVGGSVVIGAGITAAHVLPQLPTWEWIVIGILVFNIIVGLVIASAASKKAAQIRAVIPSVTPDAPRGGHKDPIVAPSQPSPAAPSPVAPLDHARLNADKAAQLEKESIEMILAAPSPAPPVAQVSTLVTPAGDPIPLMQINRGSVETAADMGE